MPRRPAIPHDELKKILSETKDVVDAEGTVRGPSHPVWKQLEEQLEGKLKFLYLHLYVKENRHGSYTKILVDRNLKVRVEDKNHDETSEDEDSEENEDEEEITEKPLLLPVTTFKLLIPPDQWNIMKPIINVTKRNDRPASKTRERLVLPPYRWESVLIEHLWEQHRLPCPYTFVRANVYNSPARNHYIKIEAHCSECNSKATGTVLAEPQDNEVVPLSWTTSDTRNVAHQKKRPLSHFERELVGGQLQGQSTSTFRKAKANKLMHQGEVEPPHLHRKPVLRKAKQNIMDRNLQIVPNSSDPIINLQCMKKQEPHAGSIHQIGNDPFFVHYHSLAQMHVFKKFVHSSRTVLALDATGSLVRRLRLPSGGRSPHIFLYEGVIKAGDEQLSVCQMLSARQDANIIKFWLDELIRQGAPIPHEVVTDNSKALLNAAVVSFCACYSLKDYYERCFHVLFSEDNEDLDILPRSFLRLDIAHLIGGAAKWIEWRDKATKRLKLFYMQCLGLLAVETNTEGFHSTFLAIGCAANSQYSDPVLSKSVAKLIDRIEGTPSDIADLIKNCESEDGDVDCPRDVNDGVSVNLRQYIDALKDEIKEGSTKLKSGTPNPYYGPDILTRFLYLLPDFLLWTAIMVDIFKSPTLTGSSARVESDFSSIKNGILSGTTPLYRVDKFVAKHLEIIDGSCALAEASDKMNQKRKRSSSSTSEESDNEPHDDEMPEKESMASKRTRNRSEEEKEIRKQLSETENWRGLSPSPKKSKFSKYLNSNPELSLVMSANSLSPPKNRVLRNGLHTGFMKIEDGSSVLLKNTCSFDVLAQMVTVTFIQYEFYRDRLKPHIEGDKTENKFLKTCQSLALVGAVSATYMLRIGTLTEITPMSPIVEPPTKKNSKKKSPSITYDCFSDLVDNSRKLLGDIFSACVSFKCSLRTYRPCTPEEKYSVINADAEVLSQHGMIKLEKSILVSLKLMDITDEELPASNGRTGIGCMIKSCNGMATVECIFGPHLIVNVDIFGSSQELPSVKTSVKIEDVPAKLSLVGKDFILSAIAARTHAHFVAYGRKATGDWETFNDLNSAVKGVKSSRYIQPVLLMYATVQP